MNMAKKEITITGGTILVILILIYIINEICKTIFLPLLILSIIGLIVAIAMTYFETDFVLYAWIGVGVLVILTIVSYGCGYGFYNTKIGKTLVDAGNTSYEAVNVVKDAEKTAQDTLKNASKQIIDDTINATNPNDPNIRLIGEVSKQEIDMS